MISLRSLTRNLKTAESLVFLTQMNIMISLTTGPMEEIRTSSSMPSKILRLSRSYSSSLSPFARSFFSLSFVELRKKAVYGELAGKWPQGFAWWFLFCFWSLLGWGSSETSIIGNSCVRFTGRQRVLMKERLWMKISLVYRTMKIY